MDNLTGARIIIDDEQNIDYYLEQLDEFAVDLIEIPGEPKPTYEIVELNFFMLPSLLNWLFEQEFTMVFKGDVKRIIFY